MADGFHPDIRARCEELHALYQSARSRNEELRDAQKAISQRRAAIHASRLRLRTELAGRLAESRDRARAATAILEATTNAADIPLIELWIDYFSLGGTRSLSDFKATMEGRLPIDRFNHDVVAVALNERLINNGFGPVVSYWDGSRAS